MKIAFLGPAYPFRGGISQFLHNMADNLPNETDVEVFTFINQYPKIVFPGKGQFEKNTQKVFNYKINRVLTPYNIFTWKDTAKRILKSNPDVLVIKFWIPFFTPSYLYVCRYLRKYSDIKIVILCHNLEFHEKWLFLDSLTEKLLSLSDKVMVLSENVYNTSLSFKNIDKRKIIKLFHPLYNVDLNEFSKEQAAEYLSLPLKPTVLFFGYIKHYKGLDVFLKSIPLANKINPDIQFIVAGEVYGNNKTYMEIIDSFNGKNLIFIDKFIPSKDISKYFMLADLIVVPYRSATQSGIVQMAYSYEKPILASDIPGLKEMIVSNKTGLLFESENYQDLADKIINFFNDSFDYKAFIRENNRLFSWGKFTSDFLISLNQD